MSIKSDAGVVSVLEIDLSGGLAMASDAVALAIRR
jgi:hypothetical protein